MLVAQEGCLEQLSKSPPSAEEAKPVKIGSASWSLVVGSGF